MTDEPDNVILRLLLEIRDEVKEHGRRLANIDFRLDEMHETMYTAAGMAAHVNINHGSFAEQLTDLKKRVTKLEEQV